MHQITVCCPTRASAITTTGFRRLAWSGREASIGSGRATITVTGTREYHQTHPIRSCRLGRCLQAWVASEHSDFVDSADSAIRMVIPWDSINSKLYSSFI